MKTVRFTFLKKTLNNEKGKSKVYFCCLVTNSIWLFCNPVDCSPPVSSVHEISQARILEWVAISFSRASFQLKDQTCLSNCRQILYHWAAREATKAHSSQVNTEPTKNSWGVLKYSPLSHLPPVSKMVLKWHPVIQFGMLVPCSGGRKADIVLK